MKARPEPRGPAWPPLEDLEDALRGAYEASRKVYLGGDAAIERALEAVRKGREMGKHGVPVEGQPIASMLAALEAGEGPLVRAVERQAHGILQASGGLLPKHEVFQRRGPRSALARDVQAVVADELPGLSGLGAPLGQRADDGEESAIGRWASSRGFTPVGVCLGLSAVAGAVVLGPRLDRTTDRRPLGATPCLGASAAFFLIGAVAYSTAPDLAVAALGAGVGFAVSAAATAKEPGGLLNRRRLGE